MSDSLGGALRSGGSGRRALAVTCNRVKGAFRCSAEEGVVTYREVTLDVGGTEVHQQLLGPTVLVGTAVRGGAGGGLGGTSCGRLVVGGSGVGRSGVGRSEVGGSGVTRHHGLNLVFEGLDLLEDFVQAVRRHLNSGVALGELDHVAGNVQVALELGESVGIGQRIAVVCNGIASGGNLVSWESQREGESQANQSIGQMHGD